MPRLASPGMPSTVPSHPAAVLALKLWRPRRFDGVALTAGAAAPDVAYLIDGSGLPVWPYSHQWLGLVGWCLPVAVVLGLVLRTAAPTVAAHLPPGGVLALRDYGALGRVRHPWWVTASSAVLGGASHLLLDDLTARDVVLDVTAEVVGVVGALVLAVHIGRRRLIRRWHGPPPAVGGADQPGTVPRRPGLFWGVAALVAVPGAASVVFLPAALLVHTTGVRLIAVVALALLAAAATVTVRRAGSEVSNRHGSAGWRRD
jgi:hypothetical protein